MDAGPPATLFDSLAGVAPEHRFQSPVHRLPVAIAADPPRLAQVLPPDWSPGFDAVVKLGAKSFRDAGLGVIAAEQPFALTLAHMFARPGPVLARYLELVRPWHATLDLTLFRYRDFTDISELRWRWAEGAARPVSRCLRGRSAALVPDDATLAALVASVAASIADRLVVDLAVEPNGRVSVLEVNPVLDASCAATVASYSGKTVAAAGEPRQTPRTLSDRE